MKNKSIITIFLTICILSSSGIYAQVNSNNDSLIRYFNNDLVFSKNSTSETNWEQIFIPTNETLSSFFVNEDNELYIGVNGVYKSSDYGITWDLLGLENSSIEFIGENNNKDLIVGSANGVWLYDEVNSNWSLQFQSNTGNCSHYYNNDSHLFIGNNGIINSQDDGETWTLVNQFPGDEYVYAFSALSQDSIFAGTIKFTGNGGGVYLSSDFGDTWNHFGLYEHFVISMGVDNNNNNIYAGGGGHIETGDGGLYRYNNISEIWDTLFYFPYTTSIVFNTENHIYIGFDLTGMTDEGGVAHSEDNGFTWVFDTIGIGSTTVNDLQIDNNGFLYALTGYPTYKLYRTVLPVNIEEKHENLNFKSVCYPNPVNHFLNISFYNNELNIENLKIQVFDLLGNQLLSRNITISETRNNLFKLDVSELSNGCYIYNIINGRYHSQNKFLKY